MDRLHPILSIEPHKEGDPRQGIRIEVRCPVTDERVCLPYSPAYENLAECGCGELITLAGALPVQDTQLELGSIDVVHEWKQVRATALIGQRDQGEA